MVAVTSPGSGLAQDNTEPAPFPEFTFKRVKPPKAGSGPRITVQIAPQEPSAPDVATSASAATAAPPRTNATPAQARYAWFWEDISPKLEDSTPGRLDLALRRINARPAGQGVTAPRLQTLQDIAAAHGTRILGATVGTRVSPALVLALISVESAGKAGAISSAGAQGLMQLMPATAARFDVTDTSDAAQNIAGGVAYLDWLMGHFDNDPILVLAGYNAGEGAVRDNGGVPPYAETRDYVPKVLAAYSVARGLCRRPPELITDGCIFTLPTQ